MACIKPPITRDLGRTAIIGTVAPEHWSGPTAKPAGLKPQSESDRQEQRQQEMTNESVRRAAYDAEQALRAADSLTLGELSDAKRDAQRHLDRAKRGKAAPWEVAKLEKAFKELQRVEAKRRAIERQGTAPVPHVAEPGETRRDGSGSDPDSSPIDESKPERRPSTERRPLAEVVAASNAYSVLSLSEAQDYAEQALGIEQANYSRFDQETANDVNATLEALMDRYPSLPPIRRLGTFEDLKSKLGKAYPESGTNAFAVTISPESSHAWSMVGINGHWASDHEKAEARLLFLKQNGFHSRGGGSMASVVVHEFAHVLYNHFGAREVDTSALDVVIREIGDRGEKWTRANISVYAAKSQHELFAELFTECQLAPEPSGDARRVGELVDGYLNLT